MDQTKIRFLGSHEEVPCLFLSQAIFNILGEITYGFLYKAGKLGTSLPLFKKKTEKRSSGLNASSALQTGSLREETPFSQN